MDRQTDKHADRRRCTDNDGHPQQIVRSAPDHSNKDTHTHTHTRGHKSCKYVFACFSEVPT